MHSVHPTRDAKGLLFGGPSAKELGEREGKDGRGIDCEARGSIGVWNSLGTTLWADRIV
jgi:hypothetical protein